MNIGETAQAAQADNEHVTGNSPLTGSLLLARDGSMLGISGDSPLRALSAFAIGAPVSSLLTAAHPPIDECIQTALARKRSRCRCLVNNRVLNADFVALDCATAALLVSVSPCHAEAQESSAALQLRAYAALALCRGVAHKFNSILQSVLGFAEVLQSRCPQGGAMCGMVDLICTSCDAGAQVVSSLLALKDDSSAPRRLTVATLFSETEELLGEFLLSNIVVTTHAESPTLAFYAHGRQLHYVLMAICYTAAGSMAGGACMINISQQKTKDDRVTSVTIESRCNPEWGTHAPSTGLPESATETILSCAQTIVSQHRGTMQFSTGSEHFHAQLWLQLTDPNTGIDHV